MVLNGRRRCRCGFICSASAHLWPHRLPLLSMQQLQRRKLRVGDSRTCPSRPDGRTRMRSGHPARGRVGQRGGSIALAWAILWSYKRVKGRSHTVEKRKSIHPHKPHSTSQPSKFSHTPRLSTDSAHKQHSHLQRPPQRLGNTVLAWAVVGSSCGGARDQHEPSLLGLLLLVNKRPL